MTQKSRTGPCADLLLLLGDLEREVVLRARELLELLLGRGDGAIHQRGPVNAGVQVLRAGPVTERALTSAMACPDSVPLL